MSTENSSSTTASELLHREMAACWRWRIETDPELAASFGLSSQRRQSTALDPRSSDSFDRRLSWLRGALDRVQTRIRREDLRDADDRLSYDLYVQQLSDYCHYTPRHRAHLCCINRLEGPQTDLPLYARYLPVATPADRAFYLRFCRAVPTQLAEVTELLRTGLREGRTPPRVSLGGVVDQIRGMVDGGLKDLITPIAGYDDVAAAECRAQIDGPVQEAFTALATFLEDEYIPNLREEISAVRGYPDGEAYYRDCLLFHTTTHMTPDEIHTLGLNEVQRVKERMQTIATGAGYPGRLKDYLEHLRTSDDYAPASAEALCARFRDVIGRIAPALLDILPADALPRMPVAVTRTPSARASTAPAAYYLAGSNDPSAPRPGMFYVNTSELSTRRTYECEALALHEAIPGAYDALSDECRGVGRPSFRGKCITRFSNACCLLRIFQVITRKPPYKERTRRCPIFDASRRIVAILKLRVDFPSTRDILK